MELGLHSWPKLHCVCKCVLFNLFHLLVSILHFMLGHRLLRCHYLPWLHMISFLMSISLQIIGKTVHVKFVLLDLQIVVLTI